jgi:hypothetical protein
MTYEFQQPSSSAQREKHLISPVIAWPSPSPCTKLFIDYTWIQYVVCDAVYVVCMTMITTHAYFSLLPICLNERSNIDSALSVYLYWELKLTLKNIKKLVIYVFKNPNSKVILQMKCCITPISHLVYKQVNIANYSLFLWDSFIIILVVVDYRGVVS